MNWCFCFRVGLSVVVGPRLAAPGLQATTVKEHGLYPVLLQLTVERNLTASHLTLGLVAETESLVFARPKGGRSRLVAVPKDKMSIKEFVHVVVFVVEPSEDPLGSIEHVHMDNLTKNFE